jgi:alanine dehydrogenase
MKIGILREIKTTENRVLLVPEDVQKIVEAGHEVYVENGAGGYSNFEDAEYESVGATILPTSEKIFETVELIGKVHSPLPIEYELLHDDHIIFSFLHLANNADLMKALLKIKATFFAMEMIRSAQNGKHPILEAMSRIAGQMAVIEGAKYLERTYGGKGILLGRTDGERPGRVTIVGAGNAGIAAASTALALGAQVNLVDHDFVRLENVNGIPNMQNLDRFEYSRGILRELLMETDLLITAVQIPGQRSPKLVKKEDVLLLGKGSVIIDLSIDQGGCVETSRPTTPDNPIFIFENIIHFCVTNLPSAVPNTSSSALSKAVAPYIIQLAQLGCEEATTLNQELRSGLNIYNGKIVNPQLAQAHNVESYDVLELFELSI